MNTKDWVGLVAVLTNRRATDQPLVFAESVESYVLLALVMLKVSVPILLNNLKLAYIFLHSSSVSVHKLYYFRTYYNLHVHRRSRCRYLSHT